VLYIHVVSLILMKHDSVMILKYTNLCIEITFLSCVSLSRIGVALKVNHRVLAILQHYVEKLITVFDHSMH